MEFEALVETGVALTIVRLYNFQRLFSSGWKWFVLPEAVWIRLVALRPTEV